MPDMPVVTVDIISDVVCPWCIIGYKKLEQAMAQFEGRAKFAIKWHPFELSPAMPPEGQDLAELMAQKYGATPEQSKANRERLQSAGADLGFEFNYTPGMRIVNTFDAHRLLHWAGEVGHQTDLKLALFKANFTDHKNISDHNVLIKIAGSVGLDTKRAHEIVKSQEYASEVRAIEAQWADRFISGVPAFIFNGKFMVPGAQEPDVFVRLIENKILAKAV